MIVTRIEALGFRSLRYGPFHVLVGPNASGKSAFLDVPAFWATCSGSVSQAIMGNATQDVPLRAVDPQHLAWKDLVCLVADRQIAATLEELLTTSVTPPASLPRAATRA